MARWAAGVVGHAPIVTVDENGYMVRLAIPTGARADARSAIEVASGALFVSLGERHDASGVLGYSLDWHTEPGGARTYIGELEYRAKWQGDRAAMDMLQELATQFTLSGDHRLRTAKTVVVPESSREFLRIAGSEVARALGAELRYARKTRDHRQNAADSDLSFTEASELANGLFEVNSDNLSGPFLVIDDLMKSGATVLEVSKCLRSISDSPVSFLTFVKTRTYHRQL